MQPYLNQYCKEYAYLDFLLNPESFDYSKINTADYMWGNFITLVTAVSAAL